MEPKSPVTDKVLEEPLMELWQKAATEANMSSNDQLWRWFENLLSFYEKRSLTLIQCNVFATNAQTEGFLSYIYRASCNAVDMDSKSSVDAKRFEYLYSFIIKVPSPQEDFSELTQYAYCYEKEKWFYATLLPSLQQQIAASKSPFDLAVPKCYYAGDRIIVLEDLSAPSNGNLKTWSDRVAGMPYEVIEVAIREIAKLHAATIAYLHPVEGNGENIKEEIQKALHPERCYICNAVGIRDSGCEVGQKLENMYNECGRYSRKIAESMATSTKGNDQHLEEIIKSRTQMCARLFKQRGEIFQQLTTKPEKHCTIVQGDMQPQNILFAGTDGKIKVRIVDFQLTRIGLPVNDVANLLFSGATRQVRRDHGKRLVKLHFDEYVKHADYMGLNLTERFGLTLEEHYKLYRKQTAWGFIEGNLLIQMNCVPNPSDFDQSTTQYDFKDFTKYKFENMLPGFKEVLYDFYEDLDEVSDSELSVESSK